MRLGARLRGRGSAPSLLRRLARGGGGAAALAVGGGAIALALLLDATNSSDPTLAWLRATGALAALFLATLGGLALASTRTRERARGRVAGAGARRAGAPSSRLLDAARLAAALLVLAAAFALLIDGAASTLGFDERVRSPRAAPEPGLDPREARGPRRDGRGPTSPSLVDPNGDSGGALPANLLSTAPVLRVRRVEGPVDPEGTALHLRGFVLDGFDAGGAPTSTPGLSRPLTPQPWRGRASALVDPFGAAPGAAGAFTLELEPLVPGDGTVFAPAPLLALVGAGATLEAERALLRVEPGATATVVSGLRSPAGLATAASRGSLPADSPWLALPPAEPGSSRAADLARIRAFARASAGRASTAGPDLARVLGVVERLRTEFGYDLVDTSFPTPRGCVALLERRTGSCTHFATTAMLALRSVGIPARIAAGYIARESADGGEAWLVRARDGHAWLEVHFAGLGWWTFDPTPPASGVANPAWTPLEISGARPRGLAGLVVRLAGGARRWVRGHWLLATAAGALALGLGLAVRALGRRQRADAAAAPAPADARPPIRARAGARLAAALRALGLIQAPDETPLAFARRADATLASGEGRRAPPGAASASDAVEASVRLLLRADAHGVELGADDASRIESLSAALAPPALR